MNSAAAGGGRPAGETGRRPGRRAAARGGPARWEREVAGRGGEAAHQPAAMERRRRGWRAEEARGSGPQRAEGAAYGPGPEEATMACGLDLSPGAVEAPRDGATERSARALTSALGSPEGDLGRLGWPGSKDPRDPARSAGGTWGSEEERKKKKKI